VTFVSKLEQSTTVAEERSALRHLSLNPSDRVIESLIDRISSPSYVVRVDALDAIQERPLTPVVQEALIMHLSAGQHTTASRAARILGLKGSTAAIEPLRRCLSSDDMLLAGRAAIALCRLGDTESLPSIRDMLIAPATGTTVLYAAAALQIGGTADDIVVLLDVALHRSLPEYVVDEVILSLAALLHFNDWFYPRYVQFTRGEAVDDIIASLEPPPLPGGLTWPEQEVAPRVRFLLDAYETWKQENTNHG
jgi:HEAT repeat protein